MSPQEFEQYWRRQYPKSPPVGYQLREAYKDRWFRVHGLPRSKRYADTEAESEEILRRHNTLLSDLLGDGGDYLLITTGYSDTPAPTMSYAQLAVLAGDSRHLFTIPTHEPDEEGSPSYWHFFMSERVWEERSAEQLLTLIADNVIANILFVSVSEECIYHPYDGGADIIMKSPTLRNIMREKYSEWLPDNASGL